MRFEELRKKKNELEGVLDSTNSLDVTGSSAMRKDVYSLRRSPFIQ